MSYLINSKSVSTEDWLDSHFTTVGTQIPEWQLAHKLSCQLVCLVNNGTFSSALVILNQYDLNNILQERGDKIWYLIPQIYIDEVI